MSDSEKMPRDETPPPQHSRTPRKKNTVLLYVIILFSAAFLLILLSYCMQQRALSGLTESVSGLKESVSAMQSVETLQAENDALEDQIKDLETAVAEKDAQLKNDAIVESQRDTLQSQLEAADWFWRIQQLYSTRHYSAARALIEEFEASGLPSSLSDTVYASAAEDSRSMAEQYQALLDALD